MTFMTLTRSHKSVFETDYIALATIALMMAVAFRQPGRVFSSQFEYKKVPSGLTCLVAEPCCEGCGRLFYNEDTFLERRRATGRGQCYSAEYDVQPHVR